MKCATIAAALHDSRDGDFFALFQLFERERQRSVHHTAHTQSPVRIGEQFCRRRTEVAADKEAGIRREVGGELLHRGFSIQRSRHVHDEAVGLILRDIALLSLHAWDDVAQRECNAQSMDDPSQQGPPRQRPGGRFFFHDGFSPR